MATRVGARQAGAVIAAVGLHFVALALLAWRLGTEPRFAGSPVMTVELVPRTSWSESELRRSPAKPPRRAVSPIAPHLTPQLAVPDAPSFVAPAAPEPETAATARRTLRGMLGCQHAELARLTPEERRRCEGQYGQAAAGPPSRLNLDVRGAYAVDPDHPYLERKPKQGCKVRAAGDVDPMGKEGAATGVACAWAF